MSATKPIAFFGLHVPAGDEPTPVMSQVPMVGTIRITMAAIDPSAVPLEKDQPNRATLKIMRRPLDFDDYMGDDYEDESDNESDEEESDEEEEAPKANGKASKADKALKKAQEKAEKMEVDAKDDEESGDDSDDESDGDFEIEEFVVCTLDPERNYQQSLEFTVDEDEEVFFKVIGNYDVYLTGNYVVPTDDHDHDHDHDDEDSEYDSEDEDQYDMSPTDSEIENMMGDSDSEDELDDVEDPRITEINSEDEKKEKKDAKKSLKRPAEEPAKTEDTPEKKLSKKQLKKLKANDGKAVDTTADTPDKKKVQFAKELEQGPTGSAEKPKTKAEKKAEKKTAAAEKPEQKPSNVRTVQGIKIEDKKEGTGAVAKNGSRLGMRYIGKLRNGKQFDANTKGKPFSFRLGKGEVIKGWDLGLAGMKVGGERRLEIPPNMAYGSKSLPGIPANSTLIFDVKLVEVK